MSINTYQSRITHYMTFELENISIENPDIRKQVAAYCADKSTDNDGSEDTPQSELFTLDFIQGKKPLRLKLKGTLTTRGGISYKKTGFGEQYTMGVDLEEEEMEKLDKLHNMINDIRGVDDKFMINNLFFKGKWFLKLKTDPENKRKWKFITSPSFPPGKTPEDVSKGTEVLIDTDVGIWVSMGWKKDGEKWGPEHKAGLYFGVNKLTFTVDDEPVKKKQKA